MSPKSILSISAILKESGIYQINCGSILLELSKMGPRISPRITGDIEGKVKKT
jgi:hypothetical protein